MYKALENQVISDKTSGTEKAKCAEVAANICIDVLKMESEGIKAVKEGLLLAEKQQRQKEHHHYSRQRQQHHQQQSATVVVET